MRARLLVPVLLVAPLALTMMTAGAQVPLPDLQETLDDFVVPPVATVRENASRVWGENLSHEDVRIYLDMEFRTLDFDALGVVFGGGTFEAQARLAARLEVRSLGLYRVSDILNGSTQGRVNLSATPLAEDVNRTHITADELRTLLAGELLAAFQTQQQDAAEAFIGEAFPDMTVLASRFRWANVNPAVNQVGDADAQDDPLGFHLLEPPIVLDVAFDLQYLKRESLANLMEQARAKGEAETNASEGPEERLLEELKAQQQAAFYERSAFSVLGLTQLLNLEMMPGWDMFLTLRLPEGYTFEEASPDVTVDEAYQSARVLTLAGDAETSVANPVLVSISNRYLVSASLLASVLLVGAILRFPATLVWGRARAWRRSRAGGALGPDGAP